MLMNGDDPRGDGVTPRPGRRSTVDDAAAPRRSPGTLTLIAAGVFALVHALAISAGIGGDFRTATILAWVAIVGTALTLVMGVVALVRGPGRWWSVLAIAVSLVANPFVFTRILVFFEGLQS
jgi:uncharacterized membrane protein (DUF2068 family)